MSEMALAAGSIAGIFTAVALERTSRINSSLKHDEEEGSVVSSHGASKLGRRMVYEAMRRVYDHERAGRITSVEREWLLAKYRAQLDRMNAIMDNFSPGLNGSDINLLRKDLITLLDQRMAQISAKIDDLRRSSMERTPAQIQVSPNMEGVNEEHKKEQQKDRGISERRTEHLSEADSVQSNENDASLEEIKKQIMQTLSRLEQAEVE